MVVVGLCVEEVCLFLDDLVKGASGESERELFSFIFSPPPCAGNWTRSSSHGCLETSVGDKSIRLSSACALKQSYGIVKYRAFLYRGAIS